ncbi:hypothetical protein quinque_012569 [Culex quinquefasciatus]
MIIVNPPLNCQTFSRQFIWRIFIPCSLNGALNFFFCVKSVCRKASLQKNQFRRAEHDDESPNDNCQPNSHAT